MGNHLNQLGQLNIYLQQSKIMNINCLLYFNQRINY